LSVAIGAALTKKIKGEDHIVYSHNGYGEMQEGQILEAAMFAAGNKVDNIISTIDLNGQQIDGATDNVLPMGNIKKKFEAFGWDVLEMDGSSLDEVISTLNKAKSQTGNGKPVMIIMKTIMGNGVDFMMHSHKWHGIAPNNEQLEKALEQLPETIGDY
jgi:transketolase